MPCRTVTRLTVIMSVIRHALVSRAPALGATTARISALSVLLGLMIGLDALFLVGLIASSGHTNGLVSVWLSSATQWVPVAIFWLAAWRARFARLELTLAAAGITLSALGDTYYSLAMDGDGYLAFPSPADAGYLLFYPLMVAALVVLVRRQIRTATGIVLLESLLAMVGASAVLAVVLDPMIGDALTGGSVVEGAISVAYPLFDLMLLAVMVGITAVPSIRLGARWWSLFTGLAIFAAADVAYALVEHQGAYLAGTPLDVAWAVGLAFITWWGAGKGTTGEDASARPRRALVIPIPAAAVLAGLVVLLVGTQVTLSTLAVVLAGLTVGLAAVPIIFRQAMLGRTLAAQAEAMQRLTDLDRDKTDMMVTMNHEFRTPLTSINGHVELLLDGDGGEIPPLAVGMLRTIEANGARLQDLVDDMLTAARLEAGTDAPVRTPLYVSGLVSRAAALVAPLARTRGVSMDVKCDNFALVVDADGGQLERAIVNVIDNAVKFTPKGGSVTVDARGPVDGHVVVEVVDTGIGIPADDLPRLSTRFFRASNVQGAAIAGVGLGLSITDRVVRAHDGQVVIRSALGEGTTVTVLLPVSPTGVLMPRPTAD